MKKENIIKALLPLLGEGRINKSFLNYKKFLKLAEGSLGDGSQGIGSVLSNFDDLELIEYLTKLDKRTEEGKKITVEQACANLVERGELSRNSVVKAKMSRYYQMIEKPLLSVLHQMESNGIRVDVSLLRELDEFLSSEICTLEGKIFEIAGEEFNINSPSQMQNILFVKLKLSSEKKSDSGLRLSTASDVLEGLVDKHEIVEFVLSYRHLHKLKSTYTQVLIKLGEAGRIRTTFLSTITSTGRLASRNPNLQNIPAKTEYGNKIRECFVAEEGYSLVCFDYSQIEIRVLAHVAKVGSLREAIISGLDVHLETASKIFDVPAQEVSDEMRQTAKMINFGIIYGIGATNLSKTLKISTKEAKSHIEEYFKHYAGIKEYMNDTVEFAERNGFVETLMGKRCYIPNIHSGNPKEKSHANRSAINARIQGSASDIIKRAMVDIYNSKEEETGFRVEDCKLLLQIHDELVFEVKEEILEQAVGYITERMENAFSLDVPLEVKHKFGLS